MSWIFWLFFFITSVCFASQPEVRVQPVGLTDQEHNQLQDRILQYPNVEKLLRNKIFRILSLETDDAETQYQLHVITYQDSKVFEVKGSLSQSILPQIQEVEDETPSSVDEYNQAVDILKRDPELGPDLKSEKINAYEPMPTTSNLDSSTASQTQRLINVGLMSDSQPKIHEIVSVDLLSKKVIRYPSGAPNGSIAAAETCGLPNANQPPTKKGTRGSADIQIIQNGQSLWTFNVTRPAASSGKDGSGLEIKNLFYKGQKVFSRAHTPILNVQYEQNKCGPFRDWTYSENAFEAHGYEKAPGIMIAAHPPTTIFDSGTDKGSFQGVAIHITSERVLLTTELSAGWYRYVSKIELFPNGTIKPSFEFSAVENSCVCFRHNHHVYWRFDFDVGGTNNSVEVSNGHSFSPAAIEATHSKAQSHLAWRILDPEAGMGYQVIPGPYDGHADSYSLGDAWLLKHKSSEIDDSRVRTSTQAGLDKFVTNENISGQDLVFWYSGHFIHSHTEAEAGPSIVGPTMTPIFWPTLE